MIRKKGLNIYKDIEFPDHYNYSKNDILDAFYELLAIENSYNLYYFPMSNLQIALEYEKEEKDEEEKEATEEPSSKVVDVVKPVNVITELS